MKLLKLTLFLIISFFLTNASFAQEDPTHWSFEAKKESGNKYKLLIHLTINKDWHVWSFKTGGDGSLVPVSFKFNKNESVKLIGKPTEKGKVVTEDVDGDGITENYLENKVDYIQEAEIAANTKITGTYSYQTCNHSMCLRPETKPFSIIITDAGGKLDTTSKASAEKTADTPKVAATAATVTTDTSNSKTLATPAANTPQSKENVSILALFFISLGGGLLALLTPCVYSMIPITVSFFTKRSKTKNEGIRNAIYYALSIILIFTILGVIISVAFGPTALYKLSTHWISNLFFFILFVVFGISFLGAFEITLPSSWTSKTDSRAGVGSFGGIFFMALTLVIVSFSCTGGIIAPLIVVASKGSIIGPAVGMFGFSLGLALPFALFAVFPGMINKMASSGGWLNQVKVVLGFLELGFALKFFSNADLVKHWRLLDREIFIAIWIVLAILLGLYLLGKLKLSHDDANPKNIYGQEYVSIFKLFLATASFVFALYLLPGMWGAPLNGLGQFIPPVGTQDFVLGEEVKPNYTANGSAEMPTDKPVKYVKDMNIYEPSSVKKLGLVTYFDYEEALAASKRLHKPVMLDFTGITCVNCRKMETQVWAQPEVLKRLREDFVVASLFCDATEVPLIKQDEYVSKRTNERVTNLGDKSLDIQISKFQTGGQPLYYYVDEDGTSLIEGGGYGYDPDVQKFIDHLEKVKANYKKTHP